jgi:hypothetical protein
VPAASCLAWLLSYAADYDETGDREKLTLSAPVYSRLARAVDHQHATHGVGLGQVPT